MTQALVVHTTDLYTSASRHEDVAAILRRGPATERIATPASAATPLAHEAIHLIDLRTRQLVQALAALGQATVDHAESLVRAAAMFTDAETHGLGGG